MVVILICKRAEQLNASVNGQTPIDPWLVAEMLHLELVFKALSSHLNFQSHLQLGVLYYKLLYFFKISPQANVHLDGSKVYMLFYSRLLLYFILFREVLPLAHLVEVSLSTPAGQTLVDS